MPGWRLWCRPILTVHYDRIRTGDLMKKTGIILLTVLLLLSSIPICANATDAATVSIASVSGNPGETVTVDVTLQNNPGMIALRLHVSYDNTALQLLDVEDKGLFGTKNAFFGKDKSANPYTVYWADSLATTNHTDNGTLCTLTFMILDTAAVGNSEITVSADTGSSLNVDLESVSVHTENGFVDIQNVGNPSIQGAKLFMENKQAALGETIEMPIYLSGNPGIVAVKISIAYDSRALTLKGVRNGTVFTDTQAHFGNDLSLQPYTMYWEDALARQNNNSNGILAILEFEVLQSAPSGDAEIVLDYELSSTFDVDLIEVPFQTKSAKISIRSGCPGDADEDGAVTLQDVAVIRRWLVGGWDVTINETNSEVNREGETDIKAALLIRRFLASGWNVLLI